MKEIRKFFSVLIWVLVIFFYISYVFRVLQRFGNGLATQTDYVIVISLVGISILTFIRLRNK